MRTDPATGIRRTPRPSVSALDRPARPRLTAGFAFLDYHSIHSYEDKSVVVEILDSATGQVDVTLETQKLGDLSSKVSMVTNRFTNVDQRGQLTTGYAISRQLSHASSTSAETVSLGLTEGNLSTFIKSLKLGKMVKYEYVPEFQSALYSPRPL